MCSELRSTSNGSLLIFVDGTFVAQASPRASGTPLMESDYVQQSDSSSIRTTPTNSAPVAIAATWASNTVPAASLPCTTKGMLSLL